MTVYCPACGGAVEVPVQVREVSVSRMGARVEVFFQERTVDHTCQEVRPPETGSTSEGPT